MHVNLIMKVKLFIFLYTSCLFGEVTFPMERKKFSWVKFENALGNRFKKSVGRPNFSVGEGFVGSVRWRCFKFILRFKYFALA